MRVFTASQMKQIEQNAADGGLSFLQMMENAGAACAAHIADCVEPHDKILILCGKGKNGGDGFVIARRLRQRGFAVEVQLINGMPQADDALTMFGMMAGVSVHDYQKVQEEADKLQEEADTLQKDADKLKEESSDLLKKAAKLQEKARQKIASQQAAFNRLGEADVIVDAVFGFGFHGNADEQTAKFFRAVNEAKAKVVAIDVPSGVECDTARACPNAIEADLTLAISYCKPGHLLYPAAEHCGEVVALPIGIAECCCDGVNDAGFFTLTQKEVRLPKRRCDTNKGTYGKVLSVCGSRRYAGAAVLAANGAVKIGAGLVMAAFPNDAYAAVAPKLTEPVLLPLPCCTDGFFSRAAVEPILAEAKNASVLLIGCGLGQTLGTASVIQEVLPACGCPIVLDADGINLIAKNIHELESIGSRAVLTPHPGEFARLLGVSVPEVQSDRLDLAKAFAQKYDTVLVLKGAATVVASPERVYVNRTGNPGMARGGSGDLLAGMIAGLIAQGMSRFDAAVTGVYLHGAVGDRAAQKRSIHGMTPSDMVTLLPQVLSDFE